MYKTLRKEVDWEHNHPAGLMLHSAAFDDSGNNVHVADVWESEEELNNFVRSRLLPVMQKSQMPAPNVEIFQLPDVSAYSGIDRYRVS